MFSMNPGDERAFMQCVGAIETTDANWSTTSSVDFHPEVTHWRCG